MKIAYSKSALKTLRKAANTAPLIMRKVEELASNPDAQANNVTALKGADGFMRLRVQDWRVIYRIEGSTLYVDIIAPRGEAYR